MKPIVGRVAPQRGWRIEPSISRVRLWEQWRWLLLLLLWLREVVIELEGYQLFGAFERICEREGIFSSGDIERIGSLALQPRTESVARLFKKNPRRDRSDQDPQRYGDIVQ